MCVCDCVRGGWVRGRGGGFKGVGGGAVIGSEWT